MNHANTYLITIGALTLVVLIRGIFGRKMPLSFWLISLIVQFIPFGFNIRIGERSSASGAFGGAVTVYSTAIFLIAMLFWGWANNLIFPSVNRMDLRLLMSSALIILISYFNSANCFPNGTLIFIAALFPTFLFWMLVAGRFPMKTVLSGVHDGLLICTIIQFVLAMCYPVLDMTSATVLFRDAGEWATRMGTRGKSAVGTFSHPGNLALFSTMLGAHFLICALKEYNKRVSWIMFLLNSIVVLLTQSRTAILMSVIVFVFSFFLVSISNNKITFSDIVKYLLSSITLITGLLLSPIGEIFLNSDANEMADARFTHFSMAMSIIKDNPIFGVGINSHLAYMAENQNAISYYNGEISEFYWENPIHNIHLIVAAETGMIGFLLWAGWGWKLLKTSVIYLMAFKDSESSITISSFSAMLIGFCLYGLSGWAPLTPEIIGLLCAFLFPTTATLIKGGLH